MTETATAAPAAPAPSEQAPATVEARRAELLAAKDEIRSLSEIPADKVTPEQEQRLDSLMNGWEAMEKRVQADELRAKRLEQVRTSTTGTAEGNDRGTITMISKGDSFGVDARALYQRSASGDKGARQELRSAAMRATEQRVKEGRDLTPKQEKYLEKLLRTQTENTDGALIARRLLITESDEYRSAFMKAAGGSKFFTEAEGRALEEFRVANEGTGSAGGYGLPVLIDPTIVLTSGAAAVPVLDLCRIVTITTNQWKGVTSAGMTWADDGESAVVADGSPTLAQPTIPVYKGDGFIPYTLEVGDDYPGFQDEMAMIMAQGYLNLNAIRTVTGSGSSQPTGVFTRMENTTTNPAHVIVNTQGIIGGIDVRSVYQALPERFRPNATWLMNVEVEQIISALGNNLSLADYTANLTDDGIPKLRGRPIRTTDYAPTFSTAATTQTEYALVVGDFNHFLFVQRAGMTVELVQHLFDPTTGRPIGQRGWYAYARRGHDLLDTNAFRLLANS